MEKWRKRKWLVVMWYVLLGLNLIIFLSDPSAYYFISTIVVGLLAINAHKLYRQANNVKITDLTKPAKNITNQAQQEIASTVVKPEMKHEPKITQSPIISPVPLDVSIFEPIEMTKSDESVKLVDPINPIEPVTPLQIEYQTFSFNVAGVTMENDKKRDIQKLLVRNGKLYCEENDIEFYGGWTNKEIIESYMTVYEFENLSFGESEISFVPEPTNEYDPNAIKVCINFDGTEFEHIGYVPKKNTKQLKEILEMKDIRRITAQYVGGKTKEVEYDDEKDKDIVVVNELTLGVEIEIAYK